MRIVETEDMWVLRAARRISISQVKDTAARLGPQIDAEIARAGMLASGPWIFTAHGLPQDGKTLFDWRMCRPVAAPLDYEGPFELIYLESIIAASGMHRGPIRTLFTQGYAPLLASITGSRHAFSGESREIYHRFDGPHSTYHEVEIQFGLAY